MVTTLLVKDTPSTTRKRIRKWARRYGYKYLYFSKGYIKLKIGRYYNTALIVFYILTFWIGAILHYALRSDLGNLEIYIYPYQWGTLLHLRGEGKKIPDAIKSLQGELDAKKYGGPKRV